MVFDVCLGCFYGVVCSVLVVAVCQMRVVCGSFVFPVLVMLGCFLVVSCCVLMMFRCFVMMVYRLL